jgi:hypothetical protein
MFAGNGIDISFVGHTKRSHVENFLEEIAISTSDFLLKDSSFSTLFRQKFLRLKILAG